MSRSRLRLPRWAASLIWTTGTGAVHVALPFGIARLGVNHGWSWGSPSAWNIAGMPLVVAGGALLGWAAMQHYFRAPEGWELQPTPWEPTEYLIESGPYRYTRNPIYIAEALMWSGWTIFFGTAPVLVATILMMAVIEFGVIPYEERGMMRQFGRAYQDYRDRVPRWL